MTTDSSSSEVSSEIAALRNQIYLLLVALIVISGTLSLYVFDQARVAKKELNSMNQIINAWNQNTNSVLGFLNGVGAYAQTHPDFVPVLARNGITPMPGVPAGAPAKPAPAAPKK